MKPWLSGHERLGGGLDGLDVGAADARSSASARCASTVAFSSPLELVALLPEQLLGLVHERVGVVADLGLLAALAVLLGVGLGVLHHLVDGVLVERSTDR